MCDREYLTMEQFDGELRRGNTDILTYAEEIALLEDGRVCLTAGLVTEPYESKPVAYLVEVWFDKGSFQRIWTSGPEARDFAVRLAQILEDVSCPEDWELDEVGIFTSPYELRVTCEVGKKEAIIAYDVFGYSGCSGTMEGILLGYNNFTLIREQVPTTIETK